MKTYKNILLMIVAAMLTITSSCKKDSEFLTETQKDNLNSNNALLNQAQFNLMSASMYHYVQLFYNSADGNKDGWILGLGTDVCYDPRDPTSKYNNWGAVNGTDNYSGDWWSWQYSIIKVANTLIAGAANPAVSWPSDAIKNAAIAEARYFRGFAYRNLANVFGGVPIVSAPVTEAKVDFVRNTREEVYAFAKADLTFAATYLPLTTTSPGRVVRAAADHMLAEVDISLKDYDGAIAATTRVINGTDGTYSLVKARFGSRNTSDPVDQTKNYYYDLFAIGNQNTQAGNNESIWNAQFEVTATGGAVTGGVTFSTRPLIERMMWCNYWGLAKIGYTGTAVDSTGRGVGYVRPTNYTNYNIWRNSGSDIRNSEACIKRRYYFGPVAVSGYSPGQLIPKSFLTTRDDTSIYVYPNWSKFGTDRHINKVPDNGYVRDFYIIRLPETYFLRAEAYLGKGNTSLAAADLNTVRARANATPVAAADVTIDYILDERARELFGEEFRILTLGRLGLIYDRTKRFGGTESAASVQPYNNLMPIPQTAIDRNVGATLVQNSGYK